MEKYLVVWPKSDSVVHINYHYSDFGEIVDYLNNKLPEKVVALDQDISNENVIDFIKKDRVSRVAMMVNFENVENAFNIANEIKTRLGIPIMAYGNIPVKFPGLFVGSGFDVIFNNGDYETSIQSFFESYPDGYEMCGAIRIYGNYANYTSPGKIKSPNEWGYSKPNQVPVFEYDKKKGKNRYVLNISRGCPFGCEHCLIQTIEGLRERRRSVENVDRALADITQQYKHIKIWAANFTLNRKYVSDFCDVMNKYPDVTWECATRIDLVQNDEMLEKMAKAGCKQISMGIESLNSGKFIESKQFSVKEVEDTIKRIQSHGIRVRGCIMLGIHGQTKQDIIDTLKFLKENNVSTRPTVFTPYHEIVNPKIKDLKNYNRKTFENNFIEGVSPEQLVELTKRPFDYDEILNSSVKTKNEE